MNLESKCKEIRREILKMLALAGSGHTGGSLSLVEIMVALYYSHMNHDPKKPAWPDRDRFVLSKGHGCPALYAVLADSGYFPKEELKTLRKLDSRLQGHPQLGLPGLEASTGSLGQGISIANGIALAGKLDKKTYRTFCVIGDGESQEGQVWEAAMTAAHYNLDNLCVIMDFNKYQIDGKVCDIKNMDLMAGRWRSFGWKAFEVDGHELTEVLDALEEARKAKGKPSIIIAHTVKGKGVSFVENNNRWHGVSPDPEDLAKALEELK